jgi:hypothetical protein
MIKRFYQEEDGRWYIDLPEYIESGVGTKSNLEIVEGADTFLSTLAQGETTITLKFEDEHFIGHHLELIRSLTARTLVSYFLELVNWLPLPKDCNHASYVPKDDKPISVELQ